MQNFTKRVVPLDVRTRLDTMNLLDRFLFNETVEDVQIYNDMVNILLEDHIDLLSWSQTEKELRVSPELRAVRLDVIGLNTHGEVYQMEMQGRNTYNLPKRSRFYQGQIDVSLLEPGCVDFNKLNDLTTILVAPFDIFGYGLYRYTFEGCCQEVPDLKLNDGAKRIFINTNGTNPQDYSKEFLDFMKYINASTNACAENSESQRIKRIHERVCLIKQSEKMGVKLMQAWEERIYDREDARAEGRAEGRSTTLFNVISNMLKDHLPLKMIVQYSGGTVEEIKEIARKLDIPVVEEAGK